MSQCSVTFHISFRDFSSSCSLLHCKRKDKFFEIPLNMFSGRIDRNLVIDGVMNDKQFHIEGKGGADDGLSGIHDMKGTFTGKGSLPFSWHVLAPFFQYGDRAFTRYPSHIHDFFKGCFPEGMRYQRTLEFEDGGKIEAEADFPSMTKGSRVRSTKVTLKGYGFDPNGPVMTKQLKVQLSSDQAVIPHKNGVSTYVHVLWPTTSGDYVVANMVTHYTSKRASNPLPKPHYIYHELEVMECTDNCLHQKEISTAHEIKMV